MDYEDIPMMLFTAFVVFLMIAGMVIVAEGINNNERVRISQETADKICQELTGEDNAVAKDWWNYPAGGEPIDKGQLSCEIEDQEEINGVVIRRQ